MEILEARLYGVADPGGRGHPRPDCAWIHAERKKLGVALELLHLEYLEWHPDGYRYTRFCDYYREWLGRYRLSMRQEHRAGAKLKMSSIDSMSSEMNVDSPAARHPRIGAWQKDQMELGSALGEGKSAALRGRLRCPLTQG